MKKESVTAAQFVRMNSGKRSKYGNKKTDGYDSGRESKRAKELCAMELAGEITELDEQVRYALVVGHTLIAEYVADFVYRRNGKLVVEDAKGVRTPEYKLKKKLMWACHRIRVQEV